MASLFLAKTLRGLEDLQHFFSSPYFSCFSYSSIAFPWRFSTFPSLTINGWTQEKKAPKEKDRVSSSAGLRDVESKQLQLWVTMGNC